MGIMLEKLIKMPCFKESELVAGTIKNRDIYVEGVTIIEVPDIVEWINGGELLLTSFYGIDKDIEAQKKLIKGLSSKGAAGIVIKTSRFLVKIPQEIINLGNELDFPIIEISGNTKYIDIMYPVMGEIFNDQINRLNYYKLCHKKFSELSLKMKGISSVAKTLGELTDNPVVIFDNELNPIAWNKKEYEKINIKDHNFKNSIEKGYPFYNITIEDPNDNKQETVIMLEPIQVLNEIRGYLGIHEANKEMEDLDFIAFESAANTLRLEMLKDIAVNEVELKYKGDLIEDLINGNIKDPEDIYDKSSILGWDLKRKFIVTVVNLSNYGEYIKSKKNLTEGLHMLMQRTLKIIDSATFSYTTHYISIKKGDNIIIFWPADQDFNPLSIYASIKEFAEKVKKQVENEFGGVKISVGIGNIANDISEISRSYDEALDAFKFGHTIHGIDPINTFDELGIYKLLCRYENREELENFIHPTLKKLVAYDKDTNNQLLETLEMYLVSNQNAVKAAEELFIHYKTMLYRLNRIKEITNLNLEDRSSMLEIEVGLKILRILKNK